MYDFTGKVVLLTGAAGGIGSETARIFAGGGAKILLADLNFAAAEDLAARLPAGAALPFHFDLGDEEAIRAAIAMTVTRWGRLDILVNNAAELSEDTSRRDRDVETMDVEVWDRSFRVNVRGTMLCCKHSLPIMTRQGSGVIVNVASNLALQGNVVQAAYSATKAAVLQMTRSIATSHGRRGIRCNAVSPGLTLTRAAAEHLPAALREAVAAETLTPYLGEPPDIAHTIAFVASDAARYITGQNFIADGGTSAHVPGFERLSLLGS